MSTWKNSLTGKIRVWTIKDYHYKKNSREKINEEKMKNLVRKGLKGKINNRKVKNKKDFKKCEKFIDKI